MTAHKLPVVLRTEKLSIGYGDHVLMRNLDLSLEAGKLICFMGPNGAGKSTLIRTLAGLQKPLSGKIERLALGEIQQQLSVVLTDRISAANMTVEELIAFGRYPYIKWSTELKQDDTAVITRAIDQVHLSHLAKIHLNELSDGQLQMAMIARALAQDTPIIIMDEPTAHLDLNNRLEIMKVLRKLTRTMNKAILITTHELDLALQTADEIWLAGADKDILKGIPEDLVLNGTFDEIFKFKGFDLRTGKVQHEVQHKIKVQLIGQGHALLWTKNALERNGFEVTEDQPSYRVNLENSAGVDVWIIDDSLTFHSISEVLHHFKQSLS